jgi:hypothetical protein
MIDIVVFVSIAPKALIVSHGALSRSMRFMPDHVGEIP